MSDERIRRWVLTNPDGSQVLVTHYPAVNLTTYATRPTESATWGPPRDMQDMTWS